MINVDRALRLRLNAVQGLGIDGDSVKRPEETDKCGGEESWIP